MPTNQPMPCGRRSEDLAEPLRKHGQRSRRDMAVLVAGHHLANCVDLGSSQLLRRGSGTGSSVRQAALTFASPGVVSRLRQSEDPESNSERKDGSSAFDCSEQERFSAAVWDSGGRQAECGYSQQDDQKSEHREQPFNVAAKIQYLLLELDEALVRDVEGDDLGTLGLEPAACGGARNATPSRVVDVSR